MLGQNRYILFPLMQRWDIQAYNIKSIKQIFPEFLVFNCLFDSAMCRRNDTHVHINEPGDDSVSMHPAEMLFVGTLAGARALDMEDRFGNFDVGKEADFVVVDPSRTPALAGMVTLGTRSPDTAMASHQTLFAFLMGMREPSVAQVYVQGRRVDGRSPGR